MILLLLSKTLTYPDWLPAAIVAGIIMLVGFVLFALFRKQPVDGKTPTADKYAMIVLFSLSAYGLFALLRMVI